MRRPDPTVVLWIANAVAWIGACAAALAQFGVLAWRPAAALPEVKPLTPAPLAQLQPLPEVGARNPFDATAGRWIGVVETAKGDSGAGRLTGVVVLPGFSAALTGAGAVKLGEPLAGGSFAGLGGDKVRVKRGDALDEILVPVLQVPTLESLLSTPPAQQLKPGAPAAPPSRKQIPAAKAAR